MFIPDDGEEEEVGEEEFGFHDTVSGEDVIILENAQKLIMARFSGIERTVQVNISSIGT